MHIVQCARAPVRSCPCALVRGCPIAFSPYESVQSTELNLKGDRTMKATEIITLNPITAAARTFKDERLTKATQRITAIYSDAAKYADTKNREIAKILGEVADKKAYEADGFKSVADYASTVFGIARQNAYALANAGKVYNDKSAHAELQAMSPSKLAELAAVDTKVVNAALEAGEITHDTTQKALREFADKAKADKEGEKPVVLDTFTARPCLSMVTDEMADTFSMGKTLDDWDDFFMDYVVNAAPSTVPVSPVEIVKLPKGKVDPSAAKATVNRRLYFNRAFSIVVEFYKYTAPKATKPATPKFTKEQLIAMLAEMEDGEKSDK